MYTMRARTGLIPIRLDTSGRDVTDLPGLHDETDCEIVATNYPHPTITSGQHTNGPASIWIRLPDGGVDWVRCRERSLFAAWKAWEEMGIDWFLAVDIANFQWSPLVLCKPSGVLAFRHGSYTIYPHGSVHANEELRLKAAKKDRIARYQKILAESFCMESE